MGSLSNYAEAKLLDHTLKTAAYTPPTNIYVGLSTADPLDDASGLAEPSGNGYARSLCNAWNAAASRATANTNPVTFPTASGGWGTVTHFALFDAVTGGNMLAHGTITAGSFPVLAGDTPELAAGDVDVAFVTGGASNYLAHKLLDHLFKTATFTQPTNVYVGFSTANPGDDAAGLAEPSGGSYARKQHNAWDAASAGATENTGAITFVAATGSWGNLSHVALFDASAAGNMLIYGAVGTTKSIGSGQTAEYADGALDVTLD